MTHGDAEVNPLKLVMALIETANVRDVDVYENTELTEEGKVSILFLGIDESEKRTAAEPVL
ncbi:hypothetical protein P6709_19785, partial [Jeotgalibacillus sp. ET6]|nr:hypothetical protein [Jeotgalibacillus sp. ET6]